VDQSEDMAAAAYRMGALNEHFDHVAAKLRGRAGDSPAVALALEPAIDCAMGEWSPWSECSVACSSKGDGLSEQVRVRPVVTNPNRWGKRCGHMPTPAVAPGDTPLSSIDPPNTAGKCAMTPDETLASSAALEAAGSVSYEEGTVNVLEESYVKAKGEGKGEAPEPICHMLYTQFGSKGVGGLPQSAISLGGIPGEEQSRPCEGPEACVPYTLNSKLTGPADGCSGHPPEQYQQCPEGYTACGHVEDETTGCPWLQASLKCCSVHTGWLDQAFNGLDGLAPYLALAGDTFLRLLIAAITFVALSILVAF